MNNLQKIEINNLLKLRESKDCIIKVEKYDGEYHYDFYNLFKQDNINEIKDKKENHYVFEYWWNNIGVSYNDAWGYTYYVTIDELLNIKEQLPEEFINELLKLK